MNKIIVTLTGIALTGALVAAPGPATAGSIDGHHHHKRHQILPLPPPPPPPHWCQPAPPPPPAPMPGDRRF